MKLSRGTCCECGGPAPGRICCDDCRPVRQSRLQSRALAHRHLPRGEKTDPNRFARLTYKQAAEILGISSEGVRQIERRAFRKIRQAIKPWHAALAP